MDNEEFMRIVGCRMAKCLSVLEPKGKEYSRSHDRLWNFRRAGEILGNTPEDACLGMMVKHFVSIMDMVRDCNEGKSTPQVTKDEKFNDLHNYLYLLEALISEHNNPTLEDDTEL